MSAHVTRIVAQPQLEIRAGLRTSRSTSGHKRVALPQFVDYTMEPSIPKETRRSCIAMVSVLSFICCCLAPMVAGVSYFFSWSPAEAMNCITFLSVALSLPMIVWLMMSGIYSSWWRGEDVGLPCRIMCWWVIFLAVSLSIALCCFCCCAGLLVGLFNKLKNERIVEMKEEYDKKARSLSGPRKEYYDSDFFKQKCNDIFDEADIDNNGILDMCELSDIVEDMLGKQAIGKSILLQECFDESHDSQVEKLEFVEMMKYLSVMQLQDGRFTEEQAFEVLLLPPTAALADVNRSYKKLAAKYNPDKRQGVDDKIVQRDMKELNEARTVLEKHFQTLREQACVCGHILAAKDKFCSQCGRPRAAKHTDQAISSSV